VSKKQRLVLAYGCLVGVPLLALAAVLRAGQSLTPPVSAPGVPGVRPGVPVAPSAPLDVASLILQIAVIMAVSRLVGWFFQKLKQPAVVGEMFGGIMLGPSLFGWFAPRMSTVLFPPATLGPLNGLSQLGVVVYMFLVGLGLNHKALKDQGHTAVLTSHVSIVLPFALGAALALVLYPLIAPADVGFTGFALFMGASMSITAFPVLARILTERRMLGTRLGSLAISCAAVDDVTGWCILAYIVILVRAQGPATLPIWTMLAGLAVFAAVMLTAVRRLLQIVERLFHRTGHVSDTTLALLLIIPLVSAVITERLGLHLLFGAFLAGVAMPKDARFVGHVLDKLQTATVVLLLPLYFASTGLRTSVRLIDGTDMWLLCAAIIVVAIVGKLGGSMIAARTAGAEWRDALGLGVLMNTRGLMELVILNIGLDVGVISPALFSMMVLMALVTTFMTTPLLEWVCPRALLLQDLSAARGAGGIAV
jgi:Kef-type K+ transport system membrane component KefB